MRELRAVVSAFMTILVIAAAAQTSLTVQRHVEGQTLVSGSLPRVTVTVDAGFRYAGSLRFPLYGVADAEQHFFVDADSGNKIRRFYWLQFEHYLPDNSNHYAYPDGRKTDISGMSFISDSRIYTDYAAVNSAPDSDSGRARAFLASKGFRLPTAAIRARLFLPGSDYRSELMIIYVEALAPDLVPPDAKNELSADDRFPELSALVQQHVSQGLRIDVLH
jgi:hypothetical protein